MTVSGLAKNRILLNSTKLLIRGSGVAAAGMAGYAIGKIMVEADKNHFDGKLVRTVSEVGEPVFAIIYQGEQKLDSWLSAR